jgi:hypothetical protein
MSVRVTALLCPDCGQALQGLRYDRIFFCQTCAQGLYPAEGGWERYPVTAAQPTDPREVPRFYLPLWRFEVEATAASANRRQEVAARRLDDLTVIWVSAFNMLRPSYYGDLGLLLTEKKVAPVPAERPVPGRFIAGCARSRTDAERYTSLFATYILDKRADVTGMTIAVAVTGAAIWAIPFVEYGDKAVDMVSGSELPVFSLDDLEDLKRINRLK